MTGDSREVLERLFDMVANRRESPVEGSYTSRLFTDGAGAIGVKVLEEAGELVEAFRDKEPDDVVHEAADLIYHTWVLLVERGVTLEDVKGELARREGVSGLEEKAGR